MKPQSAEEILKECAKKQATGFHLYPDKLAALDAIKEAQRQAVQYALQVAAENGVADVYENGRGYIEQDSILSLEQQILKDLNIQ